MSEYRKALLGEKVQEFDVSPQFEGYTCVEIYTGEKTDDGEDVVFRAVSEVNDGRLFRIENPWGSQEQARDILKKLQNNGFRYQPYSVTGAVLNPAVEIGDGVSIRGIYSGVYKVERTYNSLMSADISGPEDEEIDHEYPYESKQDRVYTRELAEAKSEITQTAGMISATVSAVDSLGERVSALEINEDEISASVLRTTGGSTNTFGWVLTASDWSLYSNNTRVFQATDTGIVTQKIEVKTGKIGSFTISNSIYSGSRSTLDSQNTGVYIGSDGIALGRNKKKDGKDPTSFFKVKSSGEIEAKSLTLYGTLTMYDSSGSSGSKQTISAEKLASYAKDGKSAYTSWSGATTKNTKTYPGYFTCDVLTTKGNVNVGGNLILGHSSKFSWDTKSISTGSIVDGNGNTQYVLKWS